MAEILSREVGEDLERAKMVGAFALHADWCYSEWANILELQPHYRQVAKEAFQRYPRSGFLEALRAAERKHTNHQQ